MLFIKAYDRMAKLHIPAQLRSQTNNESTIHILGNTVREVLEKFVEQYPNLKEKIYTDDEKIRRYVNIYLEDEDIRFLENLDTKLNDNSELSLIPAIAGGSFIA